MRLRILDLNTPWFWLTAFYVPKAYGKPWLEVGLWKPHRWKRFWFHAWQWEKIPEETGGYGPEEQTVAHDAHR